MKKFNFTNRTLFIALALFFVSLSGFSQGGLDAIGFDDNVNDEPTPITSLLIVGLAAGAAIGIKKIK